MECKCSCHGKWYICVSCECKKFKIEEIEEFGSRIKTLEEGYKGLFHDTNLLEDKISYNNTIFTSLYNVYIQPTLDSILQRLNKLEEQSAIKYDLEPLIRRINDIERKIVDLARFKESKKCL